MQMPSPERDAGDNGHGEGGGIDHGAEPAEAGKDEESRDTVAGGLAEAF